MASNLKFVIIGGSDAGISAALRARELDRKAVITVALADGYPNFSICGLPFFLSGETPDWHKLAHRTEFPGIELLFSHRAVSIDLGQRAVTLIDRESRQKTVTYDRLLIATGAQPLVSKIPGVDLQGVHPLHTMDDSFGVEKQLTESHPRSAIIVGAGYIGVEMADALVRRGLDVSLVGKTESVLQTLDSELGNILVDELRRHNVDVGTDVEAEGIFASGCLRVVGSNGFAKSADLVIMATGVRPASELAAAAGIRTGLKDAIVVDRFMITRN